MDRISDIIFITLSAGLTLQEPSLQLFCLHYEYFMRTKYPHLITCKEKFSFMPII